MSVEGTPTPRHLTLVAESRPEESRPSDDHSVDASVASPKIFDRVIPYLFENRHSFKMPFRFKNDSVPQDEKTGVIDLKTYRRRGEIKHI